MSRSRKKPYFTDHTSCKFGKRCANKRLRRQIGHIYQNGLYKKLYETWDICDWRICCPENPKANRK